MEDPLDAAQRQADEALERTNRLRRVFLEQGVQEYIQEIVNEHKQQREIGGGPGAPQGDRENSDSR